MMRTRRHLALAAIACALFAGELAHAALRNCDALNGVPGEDKIVVGDLAPSPDGAPPDAGARLAQRRRSHIAAQVRALRSDALSNDPRRQLSIRLVTCANRKPAFDGSDFTPALTERLSDDRVVLEMWGDEDITSDSAALQVGFVIPPLQLYEPGVAAAAMPALRFPRPGAAGTGQPEQLLELEAFALVGIGTKAARAKQYDAAVWAFNQAIARIGKVPQAPAELAVLRTHLAQAACQTAARARADASYRGPLRLVPPRRCGGEP